MSKWSVQVLLIFCAFLIDSAFLGVVDNSIDQCNLSDSLVKEIASYQGTVNKIIDEITKGRFRGKTYDDLTEMTDLFGPRFSCSDALEKAIDYAVDKMKKDGLENVHTEEATLKHWVRGYEAAELVKPWKRKMDILGLGMSVPTPRGGIIADVVAVETFEEFKKMPEDKIKGKIVLFSPKWTVYGEVAPYRATAAKTAAKKGAVAVLVKSLGPFSMGTPHTGGQEYEDGVKKIPAASVTMEDADMMLRMYRRGQPLQVHLEMSSMMKPDCKSYNTIGELEGTLHKNKSVVVVSGHYDSWDIGVGAMDDGGGIMISWNAVKFLKEMGLRPKRTIRAVLFTGEEIGLVGSRQYYEGHRANDVEEFNFLMESDSGTFEPRGLDFNGSPEGSCIVKEVLKLFVPLGTTEYEDGTDGGPDLIHWGSRGFPTSSLLNKNERYFWYHHTNADTMNVWTTKDTLDRCTALWTAASYVIADLSIDIPKVVKN